MANLGNLFVTIGADTRALKRSLQSANQSMVAFTNKSSKTLTGINKQFLILAGAATAAAVAIKGIQFVKGSINEFIKFENALLDLKKVLSDSEGDVEQYIGTVDRLSDQFATSAAEVLQGAANFKQAGFTIQESFKLQEKALTAARISELSVIQSSELLISVLKGFNAPVSDATRLLDGLNQVSNKFATSLGQLGLGMAGVAPIAKEMGFSFAETAALLTPIIEVFRSGTEAGIAMKTSLIRITSGQSRVVEGLRRLGIEQQKVNGQMKTGKEILTEVMKAWSSVDASQKPVIAALLVGSRQAARFSVAIRDMGLNLKITKEFNNSLGSAQKELDIRMASTEVRVDKMRVAWQNVQRDIGSLIAPALIDLSERLTEVFKSMRNSEALDTFGSLLGDLVQGIKITIDAFVILKNIITLPFDAANVAIDVTLGKIKSMSLAVENFGRSLLGLDKKFGQDITDKSLQGAKGLALPGKGAKPIKLPGSESGNTIGGIRVLSDDILDFATHVRKVTRTDLEALKIKIGEVTQAMKAGAFQKGDDSPFKFVKQLVTDFEKQKGAPIKKQKEDAERLRQSLRTPIEIFNEEVAKVKIMPFLDSDNQQRAIAKLQKDYEAATKNMAKNTSLFANTVATVLQTTGNAMGELMFNAWEGDMKSFSESFRGFVKGLNRIVFNALGQAATQKFIAPFINSILGTGGGTASAASKVSGGSSTGLLKLLGFHNGGVVTMHNGGVVAMHNGGLKADERLAKLQTGEGLLSRRDMANIGGVQGFNNLRKNGNTGMTINVPVTVEGNNRLSVTLQRNVEKIVLKTVREFA